MSENKLKLEKKAITKVVNLKRERYDIYIGRSICNAKYNLPESIFHNPFKIKEFRGKSAEERREKCHSSFREYFYERINNDFDFKIKVLLLKGKTLGCWCAPLSCHGDIIKEYIELMN